MISKFTLFSAGVFILLALAIPATGQTQRMSLVEEATNASCGPCAAQNPLFGMYLASPYSENRMIPVIYHANWPGRDVMNAANNRMHNSRVSYYGIRSVPTAVVNGKIPTRVTGSYNGAPSDTTAISDAVAQVPLTSPLEIQISESRNGRDVSFTVTVSSSDTVVFHKLRIVAVEGYHFYPSAGSNGEKDFRNIARVMIPNYLGYNLSVYPGDPQIFNGTYTIDAEWTAEEMHLVAFVQNNATKTVLQAASNKGSTPTGISPAPAILNSIALQLYPNPASGRYSVPVTLEGRNEVSLKLYDISGRYVSTLVERQVEKGEHVFSFDTGDLATGTYLIHTVIGTQSRSSLLKILR